MSEEVTQPAARSAIAAPRRWWVRINLSPNENEVRAAVLRPRRFIMTRVERTLFAVAHRFDARGIDAERRQIFACNICATIAEGEVVLLGATLVAVTFDQ